MRLLQIQEFALSTKAEYQRPVLLSEARLESVAKELATSPHGDHINPAEISLVKKNELFAYELSMPLFNGAASITLNAQGVSVSLEQGKTKVHAALMIDVTLAALAIAQTEKFKRCRVSFTVHAKFESATEYAGHMGKFTALSENVQSGGMVLTAQFPEFEGEFRYASEKSLTYPEALFFAANAVCPQDLSREWLKVLLERFETVAALEGVKFKAT